MMAEYSVNIYKYHLVVTNLWGENSANPSMHHGLTPSKESRHLAEGHVFEMSSPARPDAKDDGLNANEPASLLLLNSLVCAKRPRVSRLALEIALSTCWHPNPMAVGATTPHPKVRVSMIAFAMNGHLRRPRCWIFPPTCFH